MVQRFGTLLVLDPPVVVRPRSRFRVMWPSVPAQRQRVGDAARPCCGLRFGVRFWGSVVSKLSVVDLFVGCGGGSIGFVRGPFTSRGSRD